MTPREILRSAEPQVRKLYHFLMEGRPPNLNGDRAIECSWIAAHMPDGPGKALDFGCGSWSWMTLMAARKGFEAVGVDLQDVEWPYRHRSLGFKRCDILTAELPEGEFDLIINCSAIEHVGLDRYGATTLADTGDLEAMKRLRSLLKPNKPMLLTIPVGRDTVIAPLHRVYGAVRLPKLLGGWALDQQEYWIKDERNRWISVSREVALENPPTRRCYGLGLFVLRNTAG
jgi:2-polyprenyl-3-methyl-5-hydroxy-6-metoxy-1,4-benzoquinol methylase